MYDWLDDALQNSAEVVTASRRLARTLSEAYVQRQLAAGRLAWTSPRIRSLYGWLSERLTMGAGAAALPVRINAYQSKVLWERCIRRELNDPLLNVGSLARQARECWQRLHEFEVPLDECANAAQGRDQQVFARAALSYQAVLRDKDWIDDAKIPGLCAALIGEGRLKLPPRISMAGFDRVVPQIVSLSESIKKAGVELEFVDSPRASAHHELRRFDNLDGELRAAGAWARSLVENDPSRSVGIVVSGLEKDAGRAARLIREGAVPGWQLGGEQYGAAVNVSYGRKMSAYPACDIALRLLNWLYTDLSSRDISLLLRTPWLLAAERDVRSRLELRLRRIPERRWTPGRLSREFAGADVAENWITAVSALAELRAQLPQRDSPAEWARIFHGVLDSFAWPGDLKLDSLDYQLVNRFRELLNELASLELVSSAVTVAEAHARLSDLASEALFQPEQGISTVQVLGPLEAAGLCFDDVWIAGLTASAWPPAARPLVLVSRALQRDYNMPDADPQDTLDYSRRVLERLQGCAAHCICSHSLSDGDAQQTATNLLRDMQCTGEINEGDAGWYAQQLVGEAGLVVAGSDPVPPVLKDERIGGGAAALQWQIDNPFSAFVRARLGVQPLTSIEPGLSAMFRGTLIHDALYQLYRDLPSRDALRAWGPEETQERIGKAVQQSLSPHLQNADSTLSCLLELESGRMQALLADVVDLDRSRKSFNIISLESTYNVNIEALSLRLRVDRVDRWADGGLVIVDYKTGAGKQFTDRSGSPRDVQLLVYARALGDEVSDLAYINVDSRRVAISGAGQFLSPDPDWRATLSHWQDIVTAAARDMSKGDVRLFGLAKLRESRPLAILSRVTEISSGP